MVRTTQRWLFCSLAVGVTIAAGCAVDAPDAAGPDGAPGAAGDAASPAPVAALTLANGNQLEFYDFDTGVLISEVGKAGTVAAYRPQVPVAIHELTSLWRELAPTKPVPAALTRIETRFLSSSVATDLGGSRIADDTKGLTVTEVTRPGEPQVLAAPDGCDNGCCDFAWLSTFPQCGGGQWFHFNAGFSWANTGSNAVTYNAFVCSASGTSTYKVTISGAGGTWSIAQGFFRTYQWIAGTTCNPFCHKNDKAVKSSVNSSADQHLHTYCGYFIH